MFIVQSDLITQLQEHFNFFLLYEYSCLPHENIRLKLKSRESWTFCPITALWTECKERVIQTLYSENLIVSLMVPKDNRIFNPSLTEIIHPKKTRYVLSPVSCKTRNLIEPEFGQPRNLANTYLWC